MYIYIYGFHQEASVHCCANPCFQKGGIVGMLEVIRCDCARLESETSSAEDQAQSVYDKFINETNQDIITPHTSPTHVYIFYIWQRLINPVIVNLMNTATIPPMVTQVDPRLTHG